MNDKPKVPEMKKGRVPDLLTFCQQVRDCLEYLMERTGKDKWIICDKCGVYRYPSEDRCVCEGKTDEQVRVKIKDLTPRRCRTCLFYGSCAVDIPLEVSGCKCWKDEVAYGMKWGPWSPWMRAAMDPKLAEHIKELASKPGKIEVVPNLPVEKPKEPEYCCNVFRVNVESGDIVRLEFSTTIWMLRETRHTLRHCFNCGKVPL